MRPLRNGFRERRAVGRAQPPTETEARAFGALARALTASAVGRPSVSPAPWRDCLVCASISWAAREMGRTLSQRPSILKGAVRFGRVLVDDHSDQQFRRRVLETDDLGTPVGANHKNSYWSIWGAVWALFRLRRTVLEIQPESAVFHEVLHGFRCLLEALVLMRNPLHEPSAVVVSADFNQRRLAVALAAQRLGIQVHMVLHDADSLWNFGRDWYCEIQIECAIVHDVRHIEAWTPRPRTVCVLPVKPRWRQRRDGVGMTAAIVVDARVSPRQCVVLAQELLSLEEVDLVLMRPHPKPKIKSWPIELPNGVTYATDTDIDDLASRADFAVGSWTSALRMLLRRGVPCFSWASFYVETPHNGLSNPAPLDPVFALKGMSLEERVRQAEDGLARQRHRENKSMDSLPYTMQTVEQLRQTCW